MAEALVVDASAMVEFLLRTDVGRRIGGRLRGYALHAPAHLDAEVLSAFGRLHRDGRVSAEQAMERLEALTAAPIERHPLPGLLLGAWRRRHSLRLVDAVYVELAERVGSVLLTADRRLASSGAANCVSV